MNGNYSMEFLDARGNVLGIAECPAELFMKGTVRKCGTMVSNRTTDHAGTVIDTGPVVLHRSRATGEVGMSRVEVCSGAHLDVMVKLHHTERRKG